MLRQVCTVTLLVGVSLIAAMAFLSSTARADMGMFPMQPDVSVYEPGQKAIIAWNDGKEIMILSTDANASQATKALRVLPLPSMPKIKKGSFHSFEEVQRLIIMSMYTPTAQGVAMGKAPPAVEILFHEQIGSHDITIAKANDYEGFVEWARDFVGQGGFDLPTQAEPVIAHYTRNNIRYFVFDIIEVTEQERSIEPIVYEFETPDLYYPLVISTLIPGQTKVTLFIITGFDVGWESPSDVWPLSLVHYPLTSVPIRFQVTAYDLVGIDAGIAGLFNMGLAQLTVLGYEGPLGNLTEDLKLTPIRFPPAEQPELAEEGWEYQEPGEETVGSVTTLWPWGFNPDAATRLPTWSWIRDPGFKDWAAWKFRVTAGLANASEVWLNFGLLVTNTYSGGQGYETGILVALKFLVDGHVVAKQTHQVQLYNPFRPKAPQSPAGQGYPAYGLLQLPAVTLELLREIGPGGTLLVKVERNPESWDDDYQPHVAVRQDALLLRYK